MGQTNQRPRDDRQEDKESVVIHANRMDVKDPVGSCGKRLFQLSLKENTGLSNTSGPKSRTPNDPPKSRTPNDAPKSHTSNTSGRDSRSSNTSDRNSRSSNTSGPTRYTREYEPRKRSQNLEYAQVVAPRSRWTPEEDALLEQAVTQFGGKNWKDIAQLVPGRTHIQCLQRWKKVLQPGLVKGPWSLEEDTKLIDLLKTWPPSIPLKWADIAKEIEGRTPKQCRERWQLNLNPDINRDPWTQEEDVLLFQLQAQLGNRWVEISHSLPGRTENAVKTRFKTIKRLQLKEWTAAEDQLIVHNKVFHNRRWVTIAGMLPGRSRNATKSRWQALVNANSHLEKLFDTEQSIRLKKKDASYTGPSTAIPSAMSLELVAPSDQHGSNSRNFTLDPLAEMENLETFMPSTQQQQQQQQQQPYLSPQGYPTSNGYQQRGAVLLPKRIAPRGTRASSERWTSQDMDVGFNIDGMFSQNSWPSLTDFLTSSGAYSAVSQQPPRQQRRTGASSTGMMYQPQTTRTTMAPTITPPLHKLESPWSGIKPETHHQGTPKAPQVQHRLYYQQLRGTDVPDVNHQDSLDLRMPEPMSSGNDMDASLLSLPKSDSLKRQDSVTYAKKLYHGGSDAKNENSGSGMSIASTLSQVFRENYDNTNELRASDLARRSSSGMKNRMGNTSSGELSRLAQQNSLTEFFQDLGATEVDFQVA